MDVHTVPSQPLAAQTSFPSLAATFMMKVNIAFRSGVSQPPSTSSKGISGNPRDYRIAFPLIDSPLWKEFAMGLEKRLISLPSDNPWCKEILAIVQSVLATDVTGLLHIRELRQFQEKCWVCPKSKMMFPSNDAIQDYKREMIRIQSTYPGIYQFMIGAAQDIDGFMEPIIP
jgi:hypothetical protein